MAKIQVQTTINGETADFLCDAQQSLLSALRDELGLTGTKEGCSTGDCGACSITLDGQLVPACLVLAAEAQGREIGTVEGVAAGTGLHPIQQKFLEHAALQCGICTPGLIVATRSLLLEEPEPDGSGSALLPGRQSLPLHWIRQDHQGGPRRRRVDARRISMSSKNSGQEERKFKVVGTRPIRHDGLDKVTGRANYGADLALPGMIHGVILRSPHAHARIKKIDLSKALAMPGVKAAVTGADFPEIGSGGMAAGESHIDPKDLQANILARGKALYHGHASRGDRRIDDRAGPRSLQR